jgi:hypothetical protein
VQRGEPVNLLVVEYHADLSQYAMARWNGGLSALSELAPGATAIRPDGRLVSEPSSEPTMVVADTRCLRTRGWSPRTSLAAGIRQTAASQRALDATASE